MTDPFMNDRVKALMEAIDSDDDERARQVCDHLVAEGYDGFGLGPTGSGWLLAAAFTRAALSARSKGQPDRATDLIKRRDRLCTLDDVHTSTLGVMFELGVRHGWLPAPDYDRVAAYFGDITGPQRERWDQVERRD
jgi:hypothetical protein